MENSLSEGLRKVLLFGIGATATTLEKSKELIDELVKKGEITVEEGKVLYEEMMEKFNEKLDKNAPKAATVVESVDSILTKVGDLTMEEIKELKEKLANMATEKEEE